MTEFEFATKIFNAGGRAYLVGGAVRDKFRGVTAHDRDYCITGLTEKQFEEIFPNEPRFGKSFPVYSVDIDDKNCEVALARTEKKSGTGYRGFKVRFDPSVTIEQDLFRRDTTMNAMAIDILSGELIDPFGGRDDVLNKKIRAVSEHFTDDPVRALRAARQSAQFNFDITDDTFDAMQLCAFELKDEPGERIFAELENALRTDKPSTFFRNLQRAGLLHVTFPEIDDLRGKIQPVEFHPEGDAYEHTMQIVDDVAAVNKKPRVRFAALAHDFGKGTTPLEMLPHHYEHEKRGIKVLSQMDSRLSLPKDWKKFAALVIREHMRAPRLNMPGKIVDLIIKIHNSKFQIKDFNDIINADNHGLPNYLADADTILQKLLTVSGKDAPPELTGAQIGDWIRTNRIKIFMELHE
ncbi:MAG: HD domain-containing protein [Selenomonadaceae bacterium]|nr:HD domain-containing protein [Selenomonadaceae bacterium]